MTWVGEQIQNRIRKDDDSVSSSLHKVADALNGRERFRIDNSEMDIVQEEVKRICSYFELHIPEELPDTEDLEEIIDCMVRPLGIMRRTVFLDGDWYRSAEGPFLTVHKKTGLYTALIPHPFRGCRYYDRELGVMTVVDKKKAAEFDPNAISFFRPLPLKPMSGKDLIRFMLHTVRGGDAFLLLFTMVMITLAGIFSPMITQIIFAQVVPSGRFALLLSSVMMLTAVAVSTYMFRIVKSLVLGRIIGRMDYILESALIGRMLTMPARFYEDKSAGNIAQRIRDLCDLPEALSNTVIETGATSLLAFLYAAQLFLMNPALALPAVGAYLLAIFFTIRKIKVLGNVYRGQMSSDQKSQGAVYGMINGIQKIKVNGSENRAFAKWATIYREKVSSFYGGGLFYDRHLQAVGICEMIGYLGAYYYSIPAGVTVAEFAAFSVSFGLITGAIRQMYDSVGTAGSIGPILESAKPILETVPEISPDKKTVSKISGAVDLSHVTFCYESGGPLVINDLSLKIAAGEYVAIVGKSGCGKTTLLRLLLGFEKPDDGLIYYGNRDLNSMDLTSFRRNVGAVMQDGRLFTGDIFSNIAISAPGLSMEDAWEAARLAGIDRDIEQMPMKMRTMISEGSGGISGGQRQRLLIARAIAPRPSILMFDEATSALDNPTQKLVSESLNRLNCTRIVIAQRLSTIRQCDRILVMNEGRIVEEGTYDELLAGDGYFSKLISRQKLEQSGD